MDIILSVVLIILILIVISYSYYCYKHNFWSKQPVSNWFYFNIKDTIIANKLPNKLNIPETLNMQTYKINNSKSLEKYHKFLQLHYENQLYACDLKFNYFKWTLNYPNENNTEIITINKGKEIIGTIISKCINLIINNRSIKTSYVDYLCIDNKYRNKNIAPILISNMAEIGFKNSNSFIFKKEDKQLPFRYITKYNYYYIDNIDLKISNYDFRNIEELNEKNLIDVFKFYNNFCKINFNLYRLYSLEEFKYYFLENKLFNDCKLYLYKEFNSVKGIISFYHLNLKNFENKVNYNIKFIFSNDDLILYNLFDFFTTLLKRNSTIVLTDTGKQDTLISKYNFRKDIDCFLHMYNYHTMFPIDKKKVCLYFV